MYGRRLLLVLWAVAVGLLLRFDSPYRYAQAGKAYPWRVIGEVLLLLSAQAVALYLVLRYARARTPAGNLWRAASICFVLIFFSIPSFHPGIGDWARFWFTVLGTLSFAMYGVLLVVRGRLQKRSAQPNEE